MRRLNISTLLSVGFVVFMLGFGRVSSNFQLGIDEIFIGTNQSKCVVNEKFLSVAIDTKFIFKHNLQKLM